MFVAISINLRQILAAPGLGGRAGEAIITLLAVLFACALLLVPQDRVALGWEWIGGSLLYAVILLRTGLGALRQTTLSGREVAMILHLISALLFLAAGAATLAWGAGGVYWVVPATFWSLAIAVGDAWILLVEALR
ncbi:MAG TPA: hypothetical protein VF770_05565 [Solirubrobacterales bacterium]